MWIDKKIHPQSKKDNRLAPPPDCYTGYMPTDTRSREELRRHYELERRLANELRLATREERLKLYPKLYDELYRQVPYLKTNPSTVDKRHLASTLRLLKPFLGQDKVFLEIGAGNLAVSRQVAKYVKRVWSLDVSKEFSTALGPVPNNVELVISDGLSIPIPHESIDIAFSNQLMEHLHPDDAIEQLNNIYHALKKGGKYICNTPHRFSGPYDISMYFDREAKGFHLKEYTNQELVALFKKAGFRRVRSLTGSRGYVLNIPVTPLIWLENLIEKLPRNWRRPVSGCLPMKILLGVRLIGEK